MRSRATLLTAACLSLLVLTGCQSTGPGGITSIDIEPMYHYDNSARSLALSSPAVNAIREPGNTPGYEPWYAGRNDRLPAAMVENTGVFEVTETFTVDRQSIYNGRVYDRYDRTTYRRTFQEGPR